jgi:glycosyltransferase involved in cell wall biosynthesis
LIARAFGKARHIGAKSASLTHQPAIAVDDPVNDNRPLALVVDAYLPMPDKDSGSVRMLAMLEILQSLSFGIAFAAKGLQCPAPYANDLLARGIRVLCRAQIRSFEGWLEQNARNITLVILSRAAVADSYTDLVRSACPGAKIIYDTVDLHFVREARQATVQNSRLLAACAQARKKQELALAQRADYTLVVSDYEKAVLLEDLPTLKVSVVSNIHDVKHKEKGFAQRSGLLFVGNFNHPPNIDAVLYFVREILPGLRQAIPDLGIKLIGSNMGNKLEECRVPGVELIGYVPDLTPHLERARVSVAPLRYGAGVKGKINMSMSYGLPVVATEVAAEGLHVVDGLDISSASNATQFIQKTIALYTDADLWERISIGGQENIRRHFSSDVAKNELSAVFSELGVLPKPDPGNSG